MKFTEKYEIIELLNSGRVSTFLARERVTRERAVVYTFECPANFPVGSRNSSILKHFASIAPIPTEPLTEVGFDEGSLSAYLVTRMPTLGALQSWVLAYRSFSGGAPSPVDRKELKPTDENATAELSASEVERLRKQSGGPKNLQNQARPEPSPPASTEPFSATAPADPSPQKRDLGASQRPSGRGAPGSSEPAASPKPISTSQQEIRANYGAVTPPAGTEKSPGPTAENARAIAIFYSYSHRDETLRDELAKHLTVLRRSGLISEWHDRRILPGEQWDKKISTFLDSAQVILLLISPDFLASEYCYDIETRRALERHQAGQAHVIPVLLRPVAWQGTAFGTFQALPKNARPVTEWPSADLAFLDVCEGILSVALQWKTHPDRPLLRAQPRHFGEDEARSEKRVLDAALPKEIELGRATILLAMIRQQDSTGLRAILEIDTTYGMEPEDVRSTKTFPLKFPLDFNQVPKPLSLTITVESPDFEPKSQTKSINVPPNGDSEPRAFLLTPLREGNLRLCLDLSDGRTSIASCAFRTSALKFDPGIKSQTLVSVPLSAGSSESSNNTSGTPVTLQEPGAFTREFLAFSEDSTDGGKPAEGPPTSKTRDENFNKTPEAFKSSTGEFTSFFRGPFDQPSAPNKAVELPDPVQTSPPPRPGDFTQMFGGVDRLKAKESPSAPPDRPTQQPGSFTQIFSDAVKGSARLGDLKLDPDPRPQDSKPPLASTSSSSGMPIAFSGTVSPPASRGSSFSPPEERRAPIGGENTFASQIGRNDATNAFKPPGADPPPVERQAPSGPSDFTVFMSSNQVRESLPPDSANPAAPRPAGRAPELPVPPMPSYAAPAPPMPPPPPKPKIAAPQAPALHPPTPLPSSGATSYWPLIAVLTVLFAVAALLVMYFTLKH